MSLDRVIEKSQSLAAHLKALAQESGELAGAVSEAAQQVTQPAEVSSEPFLMCLTVFVMAVFVGYYVVWKVTPALHSPLMAITNAISSVIIVGALLAAGLPDFGFAQVLGFIAVMLAAVNIFGGFMVTQRMLAMFTTKKKPVENTSGKA